MAAATRPDRGFACAEGAVRGRPATAGPVRAGTGAGSRAGFRLPEQVAEAVAGRSRARTRRADAPRLKPGPESDWHRTVRPDRSQGRRMPYARDRPSARSSAHMRGALRGEAAGVR